MLYFPEVPIELLYVIIIVVNSHYINIIYAFFFANPSPPVNLRVLSFMEIFGFAFGVKLANVCRQPGQSQNRT